MGDSLATGEFVRDSAEREFLVRASYDFTEALTPSKDLAPPDEETLRLVSDLYFRLNRAYKLHRLPDGHRTRPEKVAALTVLAILMVRPFEVVKQTTASFYANPMFALRCGMAKVGASPELLDDRTLTRICRWLDRLRVNGVARSLSILHSAIISGEFIAIEEGTITFSTSELANVDMLVSMFDIIAKLQKINRETTEAK